MTFARCSLQLGDDRFRQESDSIFAPFSADDIDSLETKVDVFYAEIDKFIDSYAGAIQHFDDQPFRSIFNFQQLVDFRFAQDNRQPF